MDIKDFNLPNFYKKEFQEHQDVLQSTQESVYDSFQDLLSACVQCIKKGGKFFCLEMEAVREMPST